MNSYHIEEAPGGRTTYLVDCHTTHELHNDFTIEGKRGCVCAATPCFYWRAMPDETGHQWEETLAFP